MVRGQGGDGRWRLVADGEPRFACLPRADSELPPEGAWAAQDGGGECWVRPVVRYTKQFLSANFHGVFETLLAMPEVPERIFVFSAQAFSAAVEPGGGDPSVRRGADGQKLHY